MAMQTDVLASVPITADGQFTNQAANNILRCRVRGIYVVPGASAGSLVLRDGGVSGPIKITVNTVASATQPTYLLIPGQGLLFETNVYGDVTNLGSAMLIYS